MQINIQIQDKTYTKSELEWFIEQIDLLTDERLTLKVSEVAERIRILPKGSPFPGAWNNDKTPYLVEFMDDVAETSPIEVSVCMKGHQLGYTAGIENCIIYIIDNAPGPILYTTATDALGKEWSENRFDPMIEQSGKSNLIFSQTNKKKSKKTGDKTLLKEFPGGRIKIAGYGSTGAFRSSSYRYFFGDEIDEASADLKKQGNALEQAEGRTSGYKAKRKIILFSTPVEMDSSNVYRAYLLGDQRKYFIPCPYCGFRQELKFKHLKYDRDKDGVLDIESVRYECQSSKCDEYFYNYHKAEMYSSGRCEWRPTKKAQRANYRSRQMSCLYSPPGMITWADVVQKYIDAIESGDPGKLKTFQTLYLGEPYQERGEAPELRKVIAHRSNYPARTVPKDVLFLTIGCDVQGNRLEMEVCGHGRKYKTWSIEYLVIDGDTQNSNSGAWSKFKEMFMDGYFIYENEKGKIAPSMVFIDSNYRTDTVIDFCEGMPGIFPIIGQDKFSNVHQQFRINYLPGSNLMSVRIAVNYFKDLVYSSLRTVKDPGMETPPNYPEFPYSYDDSYFKMLNSEYKVGVRKGTKTEYKYVCPQGKRNEGLDNRVYNMSCRQVLYHLTITDTLAEAIENYELKMKRKILVSEKTEFFYSNMEQICYF